MDKLLEFLEARLSEEEEKWRTRALTAKSYKNVDRNLLNTQTNDELATYGDALLKFLLCEELLDDNNPEGLSVSKAHYESDRVLVDKVARHYDLIKYIRFDRENRHIPQNYDYEDDSHKYIATALEALIGAHYKIYGDLDAIRAIVHTFMQIVDPK